MNTARDQVIQATGGIGGPAIVLASLVPSRWLRVSPRVVKGAISKYNASVRRRRPAEANNAVTAF